MENNIKDTPYPSWESLSADQQDKYIKKADYLISKGYIIEDIFILAKRLYKSEVSKV